MQEVTRNDKMDCLISEIEKTVTVAKNTSQVPLIRQ